MTKLKGYRVMCGLTQEDMAKLLGISRLTYIHKENGAKSFSRDQEEMIHAKIKQKLPAISLEEIFCE